MVLPYAFLTTSFVTPGEGCLKRYFSRGIGTMDDDRRSEPLFLAFSIELESSAMVGVSKILRTGNSTCKVSRTREMTWVAYKE